MGLERNKYCRGIVWGERSKEIEEWEDAIRKRKEVEDEGVDESVMEAENTSGLKQTQDLPPKNNKNKNTRTKNTSRTAHLEHYLKSL